MRRQTRKQGNYCSGLPGANHTTNANEDLKEAKMMKRVLEMVIPMDQSESQDHHQDLAQYVPTTEVQGPGMEEEGEAAHEGAALFRAPANFHPSLKTFFHLEIPK